MDLKSTIALFCVVLLAAFNVESTIAGIDISQINVNDIQSQLPAEFANTNLTVEDAKTLFKDKCIEVAGKEAGQKAFEDIEAAVATIGECITNIANYTAIQIEIEQASPSGELDVVFNKYCKKRPEALQCIEEFNVKLEPCLDKDEKENREIFMRIVRSLLDFICHKGGDQIALFYAEKGPECLKSKKDDISNCINSTFAEYVPKEGIENSKAIPKFVIGDKQCNDIQKLETCIVEKLETCPEITPANIIESMFRFIKNETICRNTPTPAQRSTGSAAISFVQYSSNFCLLAITLLIGYAASKRSQA